MQKIATRVFMYASIAFGIVGIIMIFTGGPDGDITSDLNKTLHRLLLTTVCIILPAFALSVAGKYLKDR